MGRLAEASARERLAFEVAVHQVVVGLDDLLDDHLVRLGRVHRAAVGDVLAVGSSTSTTPEKRRPLADRHEERHAVGAEGLADLAQDPEVIDVFGVHPGQGDDPAELQPGRLLEDRAGC